MIGTGVTAHPETEAARARKRRWAIKNRNPKKEAARIAVRRAIEKGLIIPSSFCERCGISKRRRDGCRAIQAHHFGGYDNPLLIEWLCPKCHHKADAAKEKP